MTNTIIPENKIKTENKHIDININEDSTKNSQVRLDKWLWAARFYKTRPLARMAVIQGKVSYNGNKVNPSIVIKEGAELIIKLGSKTIKLKITQLTGRRKNIDEAKVLYEELDYQA